MAEVPKVHAARSRADSGKSGQTGRAIRTRTLVVLAGFTGVVVIGFLVARAFMAAWWAIPSYNEACATAWDDCVATAKIFLDRDYSETKELSKAFLTLLTAVLVASITFSEKIVDVSRSDLMPKVLMISCWGLLLLAIVACGAGLALMASAAGFASYRPDFNYREFEPGATKLLVTSGLSFGAALVALICAGMTSLLGRQQ